MTIEISGKKTACLVTDVILTVEKGKDNRIAVDYPVFVYKGKCIEFERKVQRII